MSGKGQLSFEGENPYPIIGFGGSGTEQECGLRQIQPPSHRLHCRGGQIIRIEHHGQWISCKRAVIEDIDELKWSVQIVLLPAMTDRCT